MPRIAYAVPLAYAHVELPRDVSAEQLMYVLPAGTIERGATTRQLIAEEATAIALGNIAPHPDLGVITARIGLVSAEPALHPVFSSASNEFFFADIGERSAISVALLLDLESGWMAIEDGGTALPPQNATAMLNEFLASSELTRSSHVALSQRADTLGEFLARVDKVVSVEFTVTPTNPGSPVWKGLEEYISKSKAQRARIQVTNPEGLRVSNPSDPQEGNVIDEGLAMAEAGYNGGEGYVVVAMVDNIRVEFDSATRTSAIKDRLDPTGMEGTTFDDPPFVKVLLERIRYIAQRPLLATWTD
jgi:hypothetical protein